MRRTSPTRLPPRPSPHLLVLVAASLGLQSIPGSADTQAHAQMGVHASVLPRTQVQFVMPGELTLTQADVSRGTLSLPQPVRVQALSNTRFGLEIDLQAPVSMFSSLRVQGPGIDAQLSGEGGVFVWRWNGRPGMQMPAVIDLRLEMTLQPAAAAGTYDWPLRLSARALDQ